MAKQAHTPLSGICTVLYHTKIFLVYPNPPFAELCSARELLLSCARYYIMQQDDWRRVVIRVIYCEGRLLVPID